MRKRRLKFLIWLVSASLLTMLSGTYAAAQTKPELKPGYPERYVVQEGDTLWGIANRFLSDPWRWPLIWQKNDQIENPHLIYPGDLLVVTSDRLIKTVRLEPKIYKQPLERAITTIPPNIIQPFLTSAIIVTPGEFEESGHVLSGVEDELILGKYISFYARGLKDTTAEEFQIFRRGQDLYDPVTRELLGIEGIHLGNARMERRDDDVSKLIITDSNRAIGPTDRLIPVTEQVTLPYYQPRSPSEKITGWIIHAPRGVLEVGKFDVVIITGGKREGLEEGHVLQAVYHRGKRNDPLTGEEYEVPDEVSGLMMVFRVFEKLSYAIILESVRAISVGDKFQSP